MSTSEIDKFNLNWQKYNAFLQKQDSFLADLFTLNTGKKPKYEYQRVLIGLLYRYALNFRSIYRCWGDFRKSNSVKFSIYTLLRPLVADDLLMLYLLEEFKFLVPTDGEKNRDEWRVNADDFLKRYQDVSTSFFERFDSYLKKKVKNSEMSIDDMKDLLSNQRQVFPEYFHDGPKIEVAKKRSLTPAEMADRIIKGKLFLKDLYDHYFRLSQFEHFTVMTDELMNDPGQNSEMIYIVDVTNCLLDSLSINVSTLLVPNEFRDKTVELINGFRSTQWLK